MQKTYYCTNMIKRKAMHDQILALRKESLTQDAIAKKLNISASTVNRVLKKNSISESKTLDSPTDIKKILKKFKWHKNKIAELKLQSQNIAKLELESQNRITKLELESNIITQKMYGYHRTYMEMFKEHEAKIKDVEHTAMWSHAKLREYDACYMQMFKHTRWAICLILFILTLIGIALGTK